MQNLEIVKSYIISDEGEFQDVFDFVFGVESEVQLVNDFINFIDDVRKIRTSKREVLTRFCDVCDVLNAKYDDILDSNKSLGDGLRNSLQSPKSLNVGAVNAALTAVSSRLEALIPNLFEEKISEEAYFEDEHHDEFDDELAISEFKGLSSIYFKLYLNGQNQDLEDVLLQEIAQNLAFDGNCDLKIHALVDVALGMGASGDEALRHNISMALDVLKYVVQNFETDDEFQEAAANNFKNLLDLLGSANLSLMASLLEEFGSVFFVHDLQEEIQQPKILDERSHQIAMALKELRQRQEKRWKNDKEEEILMQVMI